jgi:hypothetical protein
VYWPTQSPSAIGIVVSVRAGTGLPFVVLRGTRYETPKLTGRPTMSLRTRADTVRAPVPWRRQLCGFCRTMASDMGYEFPLLSYIWLEPSLRLTTTVKDEMPDAAGIVAWMGKNYDQNC